MNDIVVDARGLSCPQPVILVGKKIKETKTGEITVLVDTNTTKENVSRIAKRKKWQVQVEEKNDGYILTLTKE